MDKFTLFGALFGLISSFRISLYGKEFVFMDGIAIYSMLICTNYKFLQKVFSSMVIFVLLSLIAFLHTGFFETWFIRAILIYFGAISFQNIISKQKLKISSILNFIEGFVYCMALIGILIKDPRLDEKYYFLEKTSFGVSGQWIAGLTSFLFLRYDLYKQIKPLNIIFLGLLAYLLFLGNIRGGFLCILTFTYLKLYFMWFYYHNYCTAIIYRWIY